MVSLPIRNINMGLIKVTTYLNDISHVLESTGINILYIRLILTMNKIIFPNELFGYIKQLVIDYFNLNDYHNHLLINYYKNIIKENICPCNKLKCVRTWYLKNALEFQKEYNGSYRYDAWHGFKRRVSYYFISIKAF